MSLASLKQECELRKQRGKLDSTIGTNDLIVLCMSLGR